MPRVVLLLLIVLLAGLAPAHAQTVDTMRTAASPLFTRQDAIIAGAVVLGTVALIGADARIADALQDSARQSNSFYRGTAANLRDVQETNLFLASAGLYAAGRIAGAPQLADVGLHTGEAILVAWGIGGILKQVIGRPRPYVEGSDPYDFDPGRGYREAEYRSFPSLHAGGNFAAAAALVSESRYRWPQATGYIAPVAYGAASVVSLARMYENHHWASDVLLGAALGIFAGNKIVKYNHTHPENRLNRWLLRASVDGDAAGNGVRVMITRSF